MDAGRRQQTVTVWDAFVRLFHWGLVGAVLVASLTGFVLGAPAFDIHIWAGAATTVLIIARLVWGFLGSRYARFSSFVTGPRKVWRHLRDLMKGQAHRHLGHNPLGAVMIIALLSCLAAVVGTGVIFLGGVFHTGPFAALIGYDLASAISGLHQPLAILLLILVAAHIAGALFESLRTHENLVSSMLTGRKRAEPGQPSCKGPVVSRPAATILIVASIVLLVAFGSVALARRKFLGAPVQVAATLYADACSDCHAFFHPSLLPSESWKGLMTSLEDHFGEDASLAPAEVAQVTDFLVAHSAEVTETKPAHVFRTVDPAKPFQITATPFWQGRHAELGDAVFATKAVGSKGNCGACHADAASGWFYPGNIEIPEEAQGILP